MDATETQLEVEDEHVLRIPSLPQEVIAEILSRVPVRSVCKFRCVSKLWLSITSDPFFAQAHLKRTLKDTNFRGFCSNPLKNSILLVYETVAQRLEFPLRDGLMTDANRPHWVYILGSCNGLACINVDADSLFLFNPTTGESKRIPDLDGGQKIGFLLSLYGFGYDEVHDDYKVVKLGSRSETGVIYSARDDAWKRLVHGYEIPFFAHQMGSLLDGAIHWVFSSKDETGGSEKMVVVLDLARDFLGYCCSR